MRRPAFDIDEATRILAGHVPEGFEGLKGDRSLTERSYRFASRHLCGEWTMAIVSEAAMEDAVNLADLIGGVVMGMSCAHCQRTADMIAAQHAHPPCGYADNDTDVLALIEAGGSA